MVEARAADDQSKFQFIHAFYEEYFAVMDLPAEFYLETVKLVFQDHALPLGKFKVHGRPVNPGAIRRTALLTVEGERDDICGLGQTLAAQDLCTGLRQYMKMHQRADRGWPLRSLQRPALEQRSLSHGAG
jgi:poly(3-hydroxybutyrate) depolymerase